MASNTSRTKRCAERSGAWRLSSVRRSPGRSTKRRRGPERSATTRPPWGSRNHAPRSAGRHGLFGLRGETNDQLKNRAHTWRCCPQRDRPVDAPLPGGTAVSVAAVSRTRAAGEAAEPLRTRAATLMVSPGPSAHRQCSRSSRSVGRTERSSRGPRRDRAMRPRARPTAWKLISRPPRVRPVASSPLLRPCSRAAISLPSRLTKR
jgi:hypothetical protein